MSMVEQLTLESYRRDMMKGEDGRGKIRTDSLQRRQRIPSCVFRTKERSMSFEQAITSNAQ